MYYDYDVLHTFQTHIGLTLSFSLGELAHLDTQQTWTHTLRMHSDRNKNKIQDTFTHTQKSKVKSGIVFSTTLFVRPITLNNNEAAIIMAFFFCVR